MTDDPGSRRFEISISCRAGAWRTALGDAEFLAERAIRAALDVPPKPPLDLASAANVEISVLLADDAVLKQLNRDYRGRDAATNVLAFPGYSPGDAEPLGPSLPLGDIALAWETLQREAEVQGKSLKDHFSHLLVHGTLHLLGYDHESEAEAKEMEALERGILASLGVPDPYRESAKEVPRHEGVLGVG